MSQIIGTCGNCGGPVEFPMFMVNPVPYCRSCRSMPVEAYGKVIPMKPMLERQLGWEWETATR